MDLSSLGDRTAGVWTRREALAVVGAGTVRGALTTGRWQVPLSGVYADAGHVLSPLQRAYAVVLAGGGSHPPDAASPARVAACGRTAARVWRLPLIDDDDPATGARQVGQDDVYVRGGGRRRRTAAGTLHRHDLDVRDGDLVRLRSGLVLTSLLRTLVDCARLLSREALVCALDDALHRRLITPGDLDGAVVQRRGRPGAAALRAAVAVADGRAESPAETLARLLLRTLLPGLVPQVEVCDRWGGVVARVDLGDPEGRFAVEVDGKRGHAGEQMVAKDRRRDRRTGELGWATERLTWYDLRRAPDATVRRVVSAHSRQLRAVA